VLRWLPGLMPNARLAGAEIDDAAITWLRDHFRDHWARWFVVMEIQSDTPS
jgi:hypothetical protein